MENETAASRGADGAWNKDAWILRAIAAGAIRPRRDGRIFRPGRDAPKEIKFSTHKKSGRVYFTLTFEGISKSVLVNRVIGLAFLPNPENKPEVNHIDGVKSHNWVDDPVTGRKTNLEWADRVDQEKHAYATGLKATRGSANANAKLTAADVLRIREAPADTLAELAITLKVTLKTLRDIRERKTWRHL